MNDDFGKHRGPVGSDSSQTPEDATLRGTPAEEQPGLGEAADPTRLGEGLPDADDLDDEKKE